jgi:hypothetical protein
MIDLVFLGLEALAGYGVWKSLWLANELHRREIEQEGQELRVLERQRERLEQDRERWYAGTLPMVGKLKVDEQIKTLDVEIIRAARGVRKKKR